MKCEHCNKEREEGDLINKVIFIKVCFSCYQKINMQMLEPKVHGVLDLEEKKK